MHLTVKYCEYCEKYWIDESKVTGRKDQSGPSIFDTPVQGQKCLLKMNGAVHPVITATNQHRCCCSYLISLGVSSSSYFFFSFFQRTSQTMSRMMSTPSNIANRAAQGVTSKGAAGKNQTRGQERRVASRSGQVTNHPHPQTSSHSRSMGTSKVQVSSPTSLLAVHL